MKILIGDHDVISSSKLKLLLSKYGDCDVASSGRQLLEMYATSHEEFDPFNFMTLEIEMQDMTGIDILEELRKWENDHQVEPGRKTRILMIISEKDQQDLTAWRQLGATAFLSKPYDRKKMETLLEEMGLQKIPAPSTPTSQETPSAAKTPKKTAEEQTKKIDPKEVDATLKKLNAFVVNAEQFKGVDAAPIIDELVRKGGEEAELLVSQLITSDKISQDIRIQFIRSTAITRSPHSLVPLNKVIFADDNIKIIQEAVTAVSHYDNQRALNILNQGLLKFKNPMLLNTIRVEVDRIKKNKPILAILPRFLKSYDNLKNFRVTVDILKKIISPEDTPLFLNYLKSGNQLLEDGTFEILCHSGDPAVKTAVINFFEDRIQKIPCIQDADCFDLFMTLSNFFNYTQNNLDIIDEEIKELKELFLKIKDIRGKQIIISILSRSQRSEALEFIKSIYNEEKTLQEHIVDQLSFNQQAVDFLFEKYHQGMVLKKQVIASLLKNEQGLQYFIKHFFTFDVDQQEIIIRNITFSNQDYLMDFISKIYASNLYNLKFLLLNVLKNNYLFQFKETLFDEEHQREFMFMGNDYIDTVVELFPITAIKNFLDKIANEDLSNNKVSRYLAKMTAVAAVEPVLYLNDAKFINRLYNRVINANNIDLNTDFFLSLENIKILDLRSYKYLVDATNAFSDLKGEGINPKEKAAIIRLKTKLREQLQDLRDMENLQKDIKSIFVNEPIEIEPLIKILETNHVAASLKIHHAAAFLANQFRNPAVTKPDDLQLFSLKFPLLYELIKILMTKKEIPLSEEWIDNAGRMELLNQVKDKPRMVIAFKEKRRTAFLQDQLLEVIPEFEVLPVSEFEKDNVDLKDTDFFICDPPYLKDFIDHMKLKTTRIFLYLENRLDFAPFRSLNPRAFVKPFSGCRVIRMLLQELFINKQV